MNVQTEKNADVLTMHIEGRVDTTTAPELETKIKESVTPDIDRLILNFRDVQYISSAGLRVLLDAHKMMMGKGGLTVCEVNDIVAEVFDVTGFADILTVE